MSDGHTEPAAISIDEALRETERDVEQSLEAAATYAQRRQQDDRSHIAKLIVWAFVGLIGLVVAVVAIGTFADDWKKWEEPAKLFLTILSSVLLPVVTLVIGYYFGKEK
jgi:hypothetical protein